MCAAGGALLAPAGVIALVGCSGIGTSADMTGFNGRIMGTGYSVRLGLVAGRAALSHTDSAELAQRVHRALSQVDAHMSTWRPESELSQINQSADTDWIRITPELMAVMVNAQQVSRRSQGAFDVTIGPLVDLWGFGASSTNTMIASSTATPASRAVQSTLAHIGYQSIELNSTASSLRKSHPDIRIDLSGIAKGYAVDRVVSVLESSGLDSFLVEVGGELLARGRKPDGSAWRVAVERPSVGSREVFRILNLEDQAIATSGDYRNFFMQSGQRYSHSIDPRSGEPVRHALASVTVAAGSTMAADAASTALMILGPEEGMAFAEQHNLAAHFILKSGRHFEAHISRAFEPLLT